MKWLCFPKNYGDGVWGLGISCRKKKGMFSSFYPITKVWEQKW